MVDQFSLVVIAFLSGLVVLVILTTTAFAKLSIVFFIIRNALGLQQAPSNMILQTFAFVLAIYISMPVFNSVYNVVKDRDLTLNSPDAWIELLSDTSEPIKKFLKVNTDEEHKAYFQGITKEIWKGSEFKADQNDIIILVPSFMITELTRAFEIGFLLYMPFVAIDIILTVILMAMGMMMVPPTIISVPFKLLLFVMIGGWAKLVQGLVFTYGGG